MRDRIEAYETDNDRQTTIDRLVSESRRLANMLNANLEKLEELGTECTSVVGAYKPFEQGMPRSINRVMLAIEFGKPK